MRVAERNKEQGCSSDVKPGVARNDWREPP